MRVYFIGAGPGAADLITIRGAKTLAQAPVVMYAGSLVPPAILEHCHPDATKINTAPLHLDQQIEVYKDARSKNIDVARVHSGDPSIYGALAEQMRRLDELEIEYEIIPGVSSYAAAAALLKAELTKPGISQTIILTRVSGNASAVPELESLDQLAAHRATLCIFLSGPHLGQIVADLQKHYLPDTPIALVCRATWPTQKIHRSTLQSLLNEVSADDWKLTTILLVGDALRTDSGLESCLYSAGFAHKFRPANKNIDIDRINSNATDSPITTRITK